jgi:hypothetical protein
MDDLERGAVRRVNAGGLPWRSSAVARGVFVDTGCVFVLVDRA